MQCPLCLQNCVDGINLQNSKELIAFCYNKILDSSIDEGILQLVCTDCFNSLKDFFGFVQQCKASYNVIQTKTQPPKIGDVCTENIKDEPSVNNSVDCDSVPAKSKLCPICGKLWPSHSKLLKHIRSHTGQLQYKCSFCKRLLATKTSLVQHEKTHTGEKQFKCEFCAKTFGQSNQLMTHRKLHTGKDIVCDVCGKGFCRPSELRVHMRMHTGELPYDCEECGKHFRISSHLREHLLTHRGNRDFICKNCGAAFKRRSTLLEHEFIHTDEFKYKCEFCDYGCHKRWSFSHHMKKHHRSLSTEELNIS